MDVTITFNPRSLITEALGGGVWGRMGERNKIGKMGVFHFGTEDLGAMFRR